LARARIDGATLGDAWHHRQAMTEEGRLRAPPVASAAEWVRTARRRGGRLREHGYGRERQDHDASEHGSPPSTGGFECVGRRLAATVKGPDLAHGYLATQH
jgi:hypothetical protein